MLVTAGRFIRVNYGQGKVIALYEIQVARPVKNIRYDGND